MIPKESRQLNYGMIIYVMFNLYNGFASLALKFTTCAVLSNIHCNDLLGQQILIIVCTCIYNEII